MMFKKWIALLLSLVLVLCTGLPCAATEVSPRVIKPCMATLTPGSEAGTLTLSYYMSTDNGAHRFGVWRIEIYRASGTHYFTTYGTVDNGLLQTSGNTTSGTYTIHCPDGSGVSCYGVITFLARNTEGAEYESVTTKLVTIP